MSGCEQSAIGLLGFMRPVLEASRNAVANKRRIWYPTSVWCARSWPTWRRWLLHVVLRTCTVAVKDIRDVEHSIEVTAETLYEAIATALAALQQDKCGEGIIVLACHSPRRTLIASIDVAFLAGRSDASKAAPTKTAMLNPIAQGSAGLVS